MTPKIIVIAARGRNREIGKNNKLPWHIPAELQHFKRYTLGRTILMGRKTAESLGKALPQRNNLVLTHADSAPFPNMIPVSSLEEALEFTVANDGSELVIIGGEDVYRQFIHRADKLIITYVSTIVLGADAFFPEVDESVFEITKTEPHLNDNGPDYAIWTYERLDRAR